MAPRPVQAALSALCWAAVGCAGDTSSEAKLAPVPKPTYGIDRPVFELAEPAARDDAFRRGVTLGLSGGIDDEQRKPVYTRLLDDLVGAGVSDVELVVEWSQTDIKAIEITPHPVRTVDDDFLRWLLDETNNRKLRVCLTPVLDVDQAGVFAGRSLLAPDDWERWFWSYRRFAVHYARMAESHHVALYSIGAELSTSEAEAERWRDIATVVRKVYEGPITYTANVRDFEKVSFWDALDVVALTGHDTVDASAGSSDAALEKSQRALATLLRGWSEKNDRRYLLSGAGAVARVLALSGKLEPAGQAAILDQLRGARALYKAFEGEMRLEGLYGSFWLEPGRLEPVYGQPGGPGASGATPVRGHARAPAAEVLRHFYGRSRRAVVTAAPPSPP